MGESESPPSAAAGGQGTTIADRVEWLFDTIRPADAELKPGDERGRRYTYKEIADKVTAEGVRISPAYVREIRLGIDRARDPRISHLRALATAFGVHPDFLTSDGVAAEVQEQVEAVLAAKMAGLQRISFRQILDEAGLTPVQVPLVIELINQLAAVANMDRRGTDCEHNAMEEQ